MTSAAPVALRTLLKLVQCEGGESKCFGMPQLAFLFPNG